MIEKKEEAQIRRHKQEEEKEGRERQKELHIRGVTTSEAGNAFLAANRAGYSIKGEKTADLRSMGKIQGNID